MRNLIVCDYEAYHLVGYDAEKSVNVSSLKAGGKVIFPISHVICGSALLG
jgi:hypothetical protein